MNYPNLYKEFTRIKNELKVLNLDNMNKIFNETFTLSFVLMGLHLFLIITCYYTAKYFNVIINFNVKLINEKITKDNVISVKSKLETLSTMNHMYKTDPLKLINNLRKTNKLEKTHKRNSSMSKQSKEVVDSTEENKLDSMNMKYMINKQKLISPLLRMTTLIFSIYYIYSLFYYYIIDASSKTLVFNTEAFRLISDNDNQVFNTLNLLQVIVLTNNTDRDLYKRIYNTDEDKGFILNNIAEILKQRTTISFWMKEYSQFKALEESQRQLMNCDYIYTGINDDILNHLQNSYYIDSKDKLVTSLQNICKKFKMVDKSEFNYLIEEFVYLIKSMLMEYSNNDGSYNSIADIYTLDTFYDTSLISLIVIRPIQYVLTYSVVYEVTIQSLNFYSGLIIIYLILNIFVDIGIFFIIQRKVIGEILNINNELNNFIDIIRV